MNCFPLNFAGIPCTILSFHCCAEDTYVYLQPKWEKLPVYISSDKPQRRRIAWWWRNFKLKWLLRPILLLLRLNIRSYKLTPPYMDTQRGGDTVNLLWDVCSFSCPIMFPVCFGSDQQQPMVWPFTSPVSKIPVSSWLEFSVFSKGFFVSAALIKRTLWRNDGKFLHLTFLYCYTQRASLLEST